MSRKLALLPQQEVGMVDRQTRRVMNAECEGL